MKKLVGRQSRSGKSPEQVAKLLQQYLDKGNKPKQSWMEFLRPANQNGPVRWVIDMNALADRMWNVANERSAYLELEAA